MGYIYDTDEVKAGEWWVEIRTKSIMISTSNNEIEIDKTELDNLVKALTFAKLKIIKGGNQ